MMNLNNIFFYGGVRMRKNFSIIMFLCILIFGGNQAFAASDKLTLYFNENKVEANWYMYSNNNLLIDAYTIANVFPFVVPGKGVCWLEQEKKMVYLYSDVTTDEYMKERLSIKIGENKIKDFDKIINISNPAVLFQGRVYLPLRTISEAFGKKVHWKKENGKVTVYVREKGK